MSGTTYIILLIATIILTLWAQIRVKSVYNKYNKVANSRGITGAQAAREILDANGLYDVAVEPIAGQLTDHYDPRTDVISLSEAVYNGTSISAVGIAAHEVGHAIQHSKKYVPVAVRTALVPAVNFSSRFSWFLIIGGLLINSFAATEYGYYIAVGGVILFSLATLFHFVTLPVEYNASNRAKKQLNAVLALDSTDLKGARKVLGAAALTYVAALASSLLSLIRVISMVRGGRR